MRRWLLILTMIGLFFRSLVARDIILIKKFSPDDRIGDWLKIIARKKIKTTLVYPFGLPKEKKPMEKLLDDGIISLALAVENEPFWPALDEYGADLTALIANLRLPDEFSQQSDALFLQQPYSPGLLNSALATSYKTIFNLAAPAKLNNVIQRWNNLLIINVAPLIFSDVEECKNYLSSSSAAVVTLYLDEKNPFGPEQFGEIADSLVADRLIFARQISLTDFAPVSDINMFEARPDILNSPSVIARGRALQLVHQAFQDYKNSGRAEVAVIRQVEDKIFRLYSADRLIADGKNEFWNDWREIFKLLAVPVPEVVLASSSPVTAEDISADYRTENLRSWKNINPENILSRFSVEISSGPEMIFRVEMSTTPAEDFVWDIYIDLNNHRGAGSTRLLFSDTDNLDPEDGWEWALTISKNFATLYKFRNFRYEETKKYPVVFDETGRQFSLTVTRRDLGLSPQYWGYLLLVRRPENNLWKIGDVLETGPAGFHPERLKMLHW